MKSNVAANSVLLALLVLMAGVAPPAVHSQDTNAIMGVVEDARTQRPLAGVSVEVVGTTRGALTDANGRFRLLDVPGTEVTLRVSMIGYRATERTVRIGDLAVRIALTESAVELDRIVVTGTPGGTQRRSLGNVVTQIRADETVELARVSNVQSLLNARAPNVVITPATGMVGSGAQIRVRGYNSISLSNAPLLYVDGVRVDNAQTTGPAVQAFGYSVISRINDFNPDDIESIEIIKGPAAATLYGTEASNGVIHIITKKGSEGSPTWRMAVRQGANFFMNSVSRTPTNYWRNPATNEVESINLAQTEKDRGTPLYRTGSVQNYALSLSGGTAEVRYYVAGDWDMEEGAQWDNRQRRGSARLNLDVIPTSNMDMSLNVGYTGGRTSLSAEAGGGGISWASYYSTPARNQGNITPDPRGARSWAPEVYYEPQWYQDLIRFTGSVQVNHRPMDWFHHRLSVGLDDLRETNTILYEKTPLYMEWAPTGRGSKSVGNRDITNQTLDYAGTFQLDLTPSFSSNTSFGTQYYNRSGRFVTASGQDFAVPGLKVVNAAAESDGFETYTEAVTVGVYTQQQFVWNDRLFLTAALRADDHSAFGEEFSLVYYPKASAAWVVSEEPFFNVPWVTDLRLRAAFGSAGQQPGAFDALRTYTPVAGPNDVATVSPSSVGNPNLGPERSREVEAGFEVGMFEDRLGFQFTYYNQNTKDAILLRPTAPSTGFPGSRFMNIGELANSGFEIALRGSPVSRGWLKWDASFSVARNDSEIRHLTDEEDAIVVSAAYGVEHRVGYPLGGWFHRKVVSADFDGDGQVILSSMLCDDGQRGTTACYEGTTPIAPRVFLGRGDPRHEGTLTSTFTLGDRVRLYGLVDFKTGFNKWDHNTRIRCSLFNVCLENVYPQEYAQSDPIRLAAYQTGTAMGAEYIRNSKFLRLRELSASYLVPDQWVARFGASRATVTLAARNLHTWTPWTGMDPEAQFSGARGGYGPVEQNHLPQLTSIVTTINLSF